MAPLGVLTVGGFEGRYTLRKGLTGEVLAEGAASTLLARLAEVLGTTLSEAERAEYMALPLVGSEHEQYPFGSAGGNPPSSEREAGKRAAEAAEYLAEFGVANEGEYEAAVAEAKRLGAEAGEAVLVELSVAEAVQVVQGEAVSSEWHSGPLSGEWAGGETPTSLATRLGVGVGSECSEACCTAYEQGYDEAVQAEAHRTAVSVLAKVGS